MKPWSDLSLAEKVAAVREMAGKKLTLAQMAVELGTTKGAVSGIHRRSGFGAEAHGDDHEDGRRLPDRRAASGREAAPLPLASAGRDRCARHGVRCSCG